MNMTFFGTVILNTLMRIRHNQMTKPGAPTQKMLTTVKGTIHAGFGLTLVMFLIGLFINT